MSGVSHGPGGSMVVANMAHPDWGAAARGPVLPSVPLTRDAMALAARPWVPPWRRGS